MLIKRLACARIEGGESGSLRSDIGVRNGCAMSPWLFSVVKEMKMGLETMQKTFQIVEMNRGYMAYYMIIIWCNVRN